MEIFAWVSYIFPPFHVSVMLRPFTTITKFTSSRASFKSSPEYLSMGLKSVRNHLERAVRYRPWKDTCCEHHEHLSIIIRELYFSSWGDHLKVLRCLSEKWKWSSREMCAHLVPLSSSLNPREMLCQGPAHKRRKEMKWPKSSSALNSLKHGCIDPDCSLRILCCFRC